MEAKTCYLNSTAMSPLPSGSIYWTDSKSLARYESFIRQSMEVQIIDVI